MNGDGDELVAIVEGLDAAGVTLTVSNRSRHNAERRRPSRHRIQINAVTRPDMPPANDQRINIMPSTSAMPATYSTSAMPATYSTSAMPAAYPTPGMSATPRASVETTTGTDFSRINKGSQICDDRYTSSYRLAHCQMTPSSPPEAVSEFPPQRREPCRNQGNFEIGGNGSGQWSFHSGQGSGHGIRQGSRSGQVRASTSRIRHNGGSQIWRDRGSSHRYCNSKRDTDAFEHSLRRYPNLTPFRTASTDLIEKLIRYTQAKNFQEMSRSSKSMRSLRNQNSSENYELSSKHQQTYTRRQVDNVASNSGVQVGHRGRLRKFKLYSPVSDSRNFRTTETAFSTSYDYLKPGSPPDGRSNRSDGSPTPSPTGSKSPEESRTPAHSPVRFASPSGSKGPRSPERSRRPEGPVRFDGSVRDLSLSEMSKYIRTTVRQICNERPVVFQVCPKLKNRYNQHKKVCPSKNEQSTSLQENEEEEAQASGSVLSRIIRSFSDWPMPVTEQAGCQCNKSDCYCTRATQCSCIPEVYTNTVGCNCRATTIEAKTSCSRDLTGVCDPKAQEQAYYNSRIDEQISEWLKDVPVHSIEDDEVKRKRETAVNELREMIKHLPDDEDFDNNVRNEAASFIDDFPIWNPGKDEEDEKTFKSQLADKLVDKILAISRKADRFRDIVTKWVENLDFPDEDEIDKEVIIDNFDNKLKSLAAERPACDMKYLHTLRKEICELMVDLPLSYDCVMLRRKAHQLAVEIVSLPKNMKFSEDDTDSKREFEKNISEWICEHGLCRELQKDPKLIESLANKLKSQGVDDEELQKMTELIYEFVEDVETAIGILDEFVQELLKTGPVLEPVEKEGGKEGEEEGEEEVAKYNQDEVIELVSDWLRNLPGVSDWPPSKFEKVTEDLVKTIQGTWLDLENDIFEYLVDTGLPIEPADLRLHIEELMSRLNMLPPSDDYIEQAKRNMLKDMDKIIEASLLPGEKKKKMRTSALQMIEDTVRRVSVSSADQEAAKEALMSEMDDIINNIFTPDDSYEVLSTVSFDDIGKIEISDSESDLKKELSSSLSKNFDKAFPRLSKDESDLKQAIEKDVKHAVDELPIDRMRKKDLMGKVNATLCKHMNKPIPCYAKQNINDGICDILEKCPFSEDISLCGRLKKGLFDAVSQCLDFLLPKPVCDFQCKVEEDVSDVIDRCPIDTVKKRKLKKSIQDILTENGEHPLTEEVVGTIQDEINCMCDDLAIPKDKKDFVKKAVGSSVSKNLNDALETLKHDLNKIRKSLYDSMTDVIEKSPITRDVKTNVKSQLKSVLVKNLDSSISDEQKRRMLEEVSGILQDDMSEEQRRQLKNILSNKIDKLQKKEQRDDTVETITKDVDQILDRLSIDSGAKDNVKKDIQAALEDTLYNPLTKKVQQKIKEDIQNEIDEMDIPNQEKNNLKSEIPQAVTKEVDKLISQGKNVPEIKTALGETITNEIKNSSVPKDQQKILEHKLKDVLTENLVRDVTDEEKEKIKEKLIDIVDDLGMDKSKSDSLKAQLLNVAEKKIEKYTQPGEEIIKLDKKLQDDILHKIEHVIDKTPIPQEEKTKLKKNVREMATKNFRRPSQDVAEALKSGVDEYLNEQNLPKGRKDKLKRELDTAVDDTVSDFSRTYGTEELKSKLPVKILEGLEKSIDKSSIPKEKKEELKKKINQIAAETLKKRSSDAAETIKEIENNTKQNIQQGLETAIDEAPIPKEKKSELKKKVKDLTKQHFKSQLTDDVAATLKNEINEIMDDLNLTGDKKTELKRELNATVDENMSDLQRKIKDEVEHPKTQPSKKAVAEIKALETETKGNIVKELANSIDDAPIPKQEKIELNKKLKNLTTKHFKNQLSDDVAVALKEDINEVLDETSLPQDKKDELKSNLTAAVEKDMGNYHKKVIDIENKYPQTQRRSSAGTLKRTGRTLTPIQEVDDTKVRDTVLTGIEKIIQESNMSEAKKMELRKRYLTTVTENLNKRPVTNVKELEKETKVNIQQGLEKVIDEAPIPKQKQLELKKKVEDLSNKHFEKSLSDDLAKELTEDINNILEELNLPKDKKDTLKHEITATIDEKMDNFQTRTKLIEDSDVDLKSLENNTRANIQQDLGKVVDDAPIPKEKKLELKKKVEELSTKHFKKPLSDDTVHVLEEDINEVIEELNLPKDKKDKLKREVTATVNENMNNFQTKAKSSGRRGYVKELEKQTKINIVDDFDRLIDKASIPKEKKLELKKIVNNLSGKHLKKPMSDDTTQVLKDDINEVIDNLNLPKDKKNELKRELVSAIDENVSNLQTKAKSSGKSVGDVKQLEKETKQDIVQGLETVIDETPVPREKKAELKKKVKEMAAKYLQKPLSDNVVEDLKGGVNEVIEELNLPKDKKDKLKRAVTATVNENMNNFQTKSRQRKSVGDVNALENEAKTNIVQDLEKVIDEAQIPREKKIELQKKVKDLSAKYLQKPLSDNVVEDFKGGVNEVIEELNIPKDKKDKLKREVTATVDEKIDNFQTKTKLIEDSDGDLKSLENNTRVNIQQDLKKVVDDAPIPREKKLELKKKVEELSTKHFKKPLSDDTVQVLAEDINEVIEELNLPKETKDKLKREVTATVSKNKNAFQTKAKSIGKSGGYVKELEKQTKINIVDDFDRVIDKASIPKEKKLELKKIVNNLSGKHLKKPLSDDTTQVLKDDINEVIDNLNLPKDKKNELKRELVSAIDENVSNLQTKAKSSGKSVGDVKQLEKETKQDIVQGLETVIDEAPVPREKKAELKKKVKDLSAKYLQKPLSDNVVEDFKGGVNEVIEELNLPKDKKDKLKREVTATVNENMNNFQTKSRQRKSVGDVKALENEAKTNIAQDLDKVIDEAQIPREKKIELQKKVKDLSAKYLQKPLSDNVVEDFKGGVNEVIEELNLPKDKKDKLKFDVTATVNENMNNFQTKSRQRKSIGDVKALENEAKTNIAQDLDKVIDEAQIPREKKIELQKKVKDLSAKYLQKPLSDNVVEDFKGGVNEVIEELNLPKDKKDKLKLDVTATVNENMNNFQTKSRQRKSIGDVKALENEAKTNIAQDLDKVIDEAQIPKEKKIEMKKKVKDLSSKHFKRPLSDDVVESLKDDINDVMGELNLPKDKKNELKNKLNAAVDDNMGTFQSKAKSSGKRVDDVKALQNEAKANIAQDLERVIDEAPIPREKKMELKTQLKDLSAKHFEKPLSNNAVKKLKDDVDYAIEKLNLPKDKKDKLKREVTATVDDNMSNLQRKIKDKEDESEAEYQILQRIENFLEESAIPEEQKMDLKELLRETAAGELKTPFSDFEDHEIKKIKKKTKNEILHGQEKAIDEVKVPKEVKKELKKKLKELTIKHFMNPVSDDMLQAIKDDIVEVIDDMNLPENLKEDLKVELKAAVDGNMRDLLRKLQEKYPQMARRPKVVETKPINDSRLKGVKDIFDKYGIDPSYQDILAKEFDKLLDIAHRGGDFQDARKMLIEKLMRDLNLSEAEATALADELIARARQMALKDNLRDIFKKHGIDPKFEDELTDEFSKLLEIVQNGGDIEDARRKLIKKLMRDLNLSEAQATALVDDLIARARQMALSEKFANAISEAVDQSSVAKSDKPDLKDKLLNKLKELIDTKLEIDEGDIGPLKEEVLKECNKIVDKSSIPADKKKELKSLLKEKLDMAFEEDEGGKEAKTSEDYKDIITGYVTGWMNSLPIHLEPTLAATVADNIVSDVFDRHKYLQIHPEAKSSEKDEIETLKYQVFRRMHRFVNPKAVPTIMERTPELYNNIKKVKLPPLEPRKSPVKKRGMKSGDDKILATKEGPMTKTAYQRGTKTDDDKILATKEGPMTETAYQRGTKTGDDKILAKKKDPKIQKQLLKKTAADELKTPFSDSEDFPGSTKDYELKELEKKTKSDILLDHEQATDVVKVPKEVKKELKKKLKELTIKHFMNPVSDDMLQAIKDDIVAVIDDMNLPKNLKEELKVELIAAVDGNMSDLLRKLQEKYPQMARRPKVVEAKPIKDSRLKGVKDIFDKYGLDPSYQDILAKEFDKLLDIAHRGGDFQDARKMLIKKLMRDLNLSEAQATALVDDLIARARQMALSKKFANAISEAVDQSSVANSDKPGLKDELLNKLKELIDTKLEIDEDDIGPLKEEVLKECNKIVDKSSIPADKKKELKSLLKKKLDMAFEEDEGGKEAKTPEEYKDIITGHVTRWMNSLPIHLEPTLAATVADNIASDILDRHKYLQTYPEAKSSEKDEIETLKYQVFRRMNRFVDPKVIPTIMERTPELYNMIKKVKPPPLEPKTPNKMKEYKKVFGKSVDEAVEQSSLSLPDKKIVKNKVFKELGLPLDRDKSPDTKAKAEKYDVGPSDAMDRTPAALEYRKKVKECVETWLGTLPVEIDPKTAADIAENLTDDILDRQKYLKTYLGPVPTDEDEIENLMYQVFRRMKDVADAEEIPDIIKRTEDLYYLLMNIKKEAEDSAKDQSTSNKRRREPSPQDRTRTSSALSTGNINSSLIEMIATTKGVRKQWSKNLDDAVNKLSRLRNDKHFKDNLAIYDETGQIDMLSTARGPIAGSSTDEDPKSQKEFGPRLVPKINKAKTRLSKIEEAFAFNNTTKQNSPFNPKQKQISEKDYTTLINDTIKNWLETAKVDLPPNEKDRIINELVTDVVERQKYLQRFGITTVSKIDGIEYLKLQVHRRLNAFVPSAALKKTLEGMEELSTKIEDIQVPVMVAPSKSSGSQKKKNAKRKTSKSGKGSSNEELPDVNTEFSPGQTSTPNKASGSQSGLDTTGEDFLQKVTEVVTTWMDSLSIDLEPEMKTEVINDLANDIVDRQTYLQVHPEKAVLKREEIENLRFQVFKRLNPVSDDDNETPEIEKIEELYKMIYGIEVDDFSKLSKLEGKSDGRKKSLTPQQAQEFQTALRDEIATILNDYNICCERRDLLASLTNELAKLGKSNADQDEIIENMIEAIRRITYLSDCIMCDEEAEDLAYKFLARTKKLIARIQSGGAPVKKRDCREAVMKNIGDIFHECPMSAEKRKMMESRQLAEDYAKDLEIPLEDSDATMSGAGTYGMSFNGLSNFIDTWISSIHTEDDETKGESEISDMKKDMAYSLIHKIGEMNIDPEIFNDDALYETVLRDELENMLGDITISDEDFQALKEDLISKVLEAKQRAHDEFAGQAYKRKLRDTISKVLPEQRNSSNEDRATLETLKDQLADAYIDLHFTGNNESQREKLKSKIANELSRYCRDYMNRIPCSPLNSQKINQDLYTALNNIPLPAGDSIKYEVEQARIREEINDWLKELPIQPQSPTELQTRNKMVYVLAKKLFDIELEGNDAENEQMRAEIVKFLNKLPLETEEDYETLADKLLEKLTATEESRKYSPSSSVTLDSFGNISLDTPVCSGHKSIFDRRNAISGPSSSPHVCGRPTCKQPRPMPPCTLSPEDLDHLERIKRRTCLSPSCAKSIMKNTNRKTCPGPRPVDAGSQTVLRPFGYETAQSPVCPSTNERKPRTCPGQPAKEFSQGRIPCGKEKPRLPLCPATPQKAAGSCPGIPRSPPQCGHQLRRHTISSGNVSDYDGEVQPQIVIKQYYWTPNEKNRPEESDIPEGSRGNRGQSNPSPSNQTRQSQNDKTRQSSYAQCAPPPCRRPSFDKIQEEDTGPSRVPCEFMTSPEPKFQRQPSNNSYSEQSNRNMLSSRPPCMPPPCMPSPCMSPFGLNKQASPGNSYFPKTDNECRIPKRDGLDHKDQMPGSSSSPSRKERVIELGSLDDLCNARPKKRQNDGNDWPFHEEEEEEEDNFWTTPIRRVLVDEGIDDSVVMEREQREERIRCKCKERLVPKCQAGRSTLGTCPSQQYTQSNEGGQNLKKCAKCCGRHCPYPSFLYFRK